jgi:hypothetical protein
MRKGEQHQDGDDANRVHGRLDGRKPQLPLTFLLLFWACAISAGPAAMADADVKICGAIAAGQEVIASSDVIAGALAG